MQKVMSLFILVLFSAAAFGGLRADLDGDGRVDLADLAILAEEWLTSEPPSAVQITGNLTPDATGKYAYAGEYNGLPYYVRADSNWFIWYCEPLENDVITNVLGHGLDDPHWRREIEDPMDQYSPAHGAVGIAKISKHVITKMNPTLKFFNQWSASFVWRPECHWREIYEILPIAIFRAVDNGYFYLYYEATWDSNYRLGGRFVLTNGSQSMEVTANGGWLLADTLKFAVVYDTSAGVSLYIETVSDGLLEGSSADMSFAGNTPLHFVQFSATPAGQIKGLGAYGEVKLYNTAIGVEDIDRLFSLSPLAPTPQIYHKVDNLVFARDSIRFDHHVKPIEAGKPMIQTVPIAGRITDAVYSAESDVSFDVPIGVIGDRCYVNRGNIAIRYTTDALTYHGHVSLSSREETSGLYAAGFRLRSAVLLDDGYILFVMNNGDKGYLFRFNPDTEAISSCTILGEEITDNAMLGYPDNFSWTGVRGNEIVVGEYGSKNNPNTAKRVYYSDNYGQSFKLIYIHEKNIGDQSHIHLCIFHPTRTDIAYVSVGDSSWRNLVKLKRFGDEWVAESTHLPIQPTAAIEIGNKILFGQDGSSPHPNLFLFDPNDNSIEAILRLPVQQLTYFDGPFSTPETASYVWSIKKFGDIYYAAMAIGGASYAGGIYASLDGRSWVRLIEENVTTGFWRIAGLDSNGKLWVSYHTPGGMRKPYFFAPPTIQNVQVISTERGISNLLTENESLFTESISDWMPSGSLSSIETKRDEAVSLYGGASMKLVGQYNGSHAYFQTRIPVSLSAGERFNLRAYIKLGGALATVIDGAYSVPAMRLELQHSPTANLPYARSTFSALTDGWFIATVWGKAIEAYSGNIQLFFSFPEYPLDAYDDLVVWVDCVQLIKGYDIHYSGTFQPGGVPRADEVLIAPAY